MSGGRRRSLGICLGRFGKRNLIGGAKSQSKGVFKRFLSLEGIVSAAHCAQKVTVCVENEEVIIGGDTSILIKQIVPLQKQIVSRFCRPGHHYRRNRFGSAVWVPIVPTTRGQCWIKVIGRVLIGDIQLEIAMMTLSPYIRIR